MDNQPPPSAQPPELHQTSRTPGARGRAVPVLEALAHVYSYPRSDPACVARRAHAFAQKQECAAARPGISRFPNTRNRIWRLPRVGSSPGLIQAFTRAWSASGATIGIHDGVAAEPSAPEPGLMRIFQQVLWRAWLAWACFPLSPGLADVINRVIQVVAKRIEPSSPGKRCGRLPVQPGANGGIRAR